MGATNHKKLFEHTDKRIVKPINEAAAGVLAQETMLYEYWTHKRESWSEAQSDRAVNAHNILDKAGDHLKAAKKATLKARSIQHKMMMNNLKSPPKAKKGRNNQPTPLTQESLNKGRR